MKLSLYSILAMLALVSLNLIETLLNQKHPLHFLLRFYTLFSTLLLILLALMGICYWVKPNGSICNLSEEKLIIVSAIWCWTTLVISLISVYDFPSDVSYAPLLCFYFVVSISMLLVAD